MNTPQDKCACPGMNRTYNRVSELKRQGNYAAAFLIASIALKDRIEAIYAVSLGENLDELSKSRHYGFKFEEVIKLDLFDELEKEILTTAVKHITSVEQALLWTESEVEFPEVEVIINGIMILDHVRKSIKRTEGVNNGDT